MPWRLLPTSKEDLAKLELEIQKELKSRQLEQYKPYPRQFEFHQAGKDHRERLFMAGNQLGKTVAGSMEAAMHATGRYPPWWPGRRFDKPTAGWASGITGETVRDTVQRLLVGRSGEWGTGSIPAECIDDMTTARGIAELVDTIRIKHPKGTSVISLKSYEKGREKWQGETLDWVWFDEEPPEDIYGEGLTRTAATGGMTWMTFTPLMGMSRVVQRFLGNERSLDQHVTTMTIEDAGHYTEADRKKIVAGYAPHEREARARGIPMLGSGRVFPIAEEVITYENVQLPDHWPRIVGLDIGWDHPTAAVWLAWDRDTDTVYVYDAHRVRQESVIVHAAAIKSRGDWIPVAWPHDALQHDKMSGEQIAKGYRDQKVSMLPMRAQFVDGSYGVEAGIALMLSRMQERRIRVAKHLNDWWQEFRIYHRDEGKIVKDMDDLMSATRYALMMLRFAKTRLETKGSTGFKRKLEPSGNYAPA